MIQVGIDGRILYYNRSGISRFAMGFLGALQLPQSNLWIGDLDLVLYRSWKHRLRRNSGGCREEFPTSGLRIRGRNLLTPSHFRFESLALGCELPRQRNTLVHALDYFTTLEARVPTIDTYYDLYFLKSPEVLDSASLRHYNQIHKAAKYAKHVITTSYSSKLDVVSLLGVSEEKVSVVYPGPPVLAAADMALADRLRKRFQLSDENLLFVSTIEPRKNLEILVKSYQHLLQKRRSQLPELLLVGRKGYGSERLFALIKKLSLENKVKYLGELNDKELRAIYSLSVMLIYPSKYEGFGFPVLEALAADVPVITSSVSSLPEVGGDAVHYVNPESIDSISDAIEYLLLHPDYREELIARGQHRLKFFSWDECASQILEIYRNAASSI